MEPLEGRHFSNASEIQQLWQALESSTDLASEKDRIQVLRFIASVCSDHLQVLNASLISSFFSTMQSFKSRDSHSNNGGVADISEDELKHCIDAFAAVSENGLKINGLEDKVADFVAHLLEKVLAISLRGQSGPINSSDQEDNAKGSILVDKLLYLVGSLLDSCYDSFDKRHLSAIIVAVSGLILCFVPTPTTVDFCLNVVDAALKGPAGTGKAPIQQRTGFTTHAPSLANVPYDTLQCALFALCCVRNKETSPKVWEIMTTLLKSHRSRSACSILLQHLDIDSRSQHFVQWGVSASFTSPFNSQVQAASIRLIAKAHWGDDKISGLHMSISFILSHLSSVAQHSIDGYLSNSDPQYEVVIREIVSSLNSLLESENEALSLGIWELILQICQHLSRLWIAIINSTPSLSQNLIKIGDSFSNESTTFTAASTLYTSIAIVISKVQERYMTVQGCNRVLCFSMLLELAGHLSPALSQRLLEYLPSMLRDWHGDTKSVIQRISNIYIIREDDDTLRLKSLDFIVDNLGLIVTLDDATGVLLQVLECLKEGQSSDVFAHRVMDLVLQLVPLVDVEVLTEICETLKELLMTSMSEERSLLILSTLIKTFCRTLSDTGGRGCDKLFDILVGLAFTTGDKSAAPSIRLKCLEFLTKCHADSLGVLHFKAELSPPATSSMFNMNVKSIGILATKNDEKSSTRSDIATYINIPLYLEAICKLLSAEPVWAVYSYVLQNIDQQLNNLTLFAGSDTPIQALRAALCAIIADESACSSIRDLPASVKKSDVYLWAFQVLAALMPYRHCFTRPQLEDILSAFQLGLHKWPSTARFCLQTLTLALTEIPSVMLRHLPNTLMRISRITSSSMAPTILEFLSTLARLPGLYVNLSDVELRRIFGMALQHIQSSPQITPPTPSQNASAASRSSSATPQYVLQLAYHVVTLWFSSLKMNDRRKYVSFIIKSLLSQGLKVDASTDTLDENLELVLDVLVLNSYVDCTSSPGSLSALQSNSDNLGDSSAMTERSWIMGNGIVTVKSGKVSGWAEVLIRRPSGSLSFWIKLENRPRTAELMSSVDIHATVEFAARELVDDDKNDESELSEQESNLLQVQRQNAGRSGSVDSSLLPTVSASVDGQTLDGLASTEKDLRLRSQSLSKMLSNPELKAPSSTTTRKRSFLQPGNASMLPMDPSFILMQLTPYPSLQSSNIPILLPSDDAVSRALKILDRTPVVDLHKIGVIYLGPGQSIETDILSNTHGSQLYTRFLHSLGRLFHLSDAVSLGIYTGGLDTSTDAIDGKVGIVWEDHASGTQMMFHVTTLMPTNLAHDPQCSLKKRHIGNDFVVIAFDESGLDTFNFNTLPGQFNFVNIVVKPIDSFTIAPEDETESAGGKDKASNDFDRRWFYVETRVRDDLDLPNLSVLSDGRVVCGRELAGVLRRAALHANMLALVVAQSGAGGGMFTSNARERLRQIKRIGERVKKGAAGSAAAAAAEKSLQQSQSAPATVRIEADVALDFTRYS
ncbi:Tuberous sclerosis 2-like protein [Chytridiales sp. JEL 0842]|nr:Tuberous sclerosis 2-like protein [Chytridiales sp. JEL 0842]